MVFVQPKEVTFRFGNERISPKKVFQLMYRGLEELIAFNIGENPKEKRLDTRSYERQRKKNSSRTTQVNGWKTTIPSINAQFVYDDLSTEEFVVIPRTNFFMQNIIKAPSIVELRSRQKTIILREARTYDLQKRGIINILRGNTFKNNQFDFERSRQFNRDLKSQVEDTQKVMLIPEPNLLLAIEQLYKDGLVARITPEITPIDFDKQNMWFLRDYLSTFIDTPLTPEQFGIHFGIMYSLGLVDPDRQLVHYARQHGKVVNYDPDLMCFTHKQSLLWQKDFNDFRRELEDETNKTGIIRLLPDEILETKKNAQKYYQFLGERGVTPDTFLHYVPKNIKDKLNAMSKLSNY